jgi:hypothetical protein
MTPSRSLLTLILSGLSVVAAQADGPLTPDQFRQLFQVIHPKAAEQKWTQIPWHTNLWEARREAAAAGKPILLWEMDGHPLGCT